MKTIADERAGFLKCVHCPSLIPPDESVVFVPGDGFAHGDGCPGRWQPEASEPEVPWGLHWIPAAQVDAA